MPLVVLAPLDVVIAALGLLLVLWAWNTFLVKPIAWALSQVPVIGRQMADALTSSAAVVYAWAHALAIVGVDAIVQVVSAPFHQVGVFFGELVVTVETAGAKIVALVATTVNLGALVRSVGNALGNGLATLSQRIVALGQSVAGTAAAVFHTLIAPVETALRAAIAAAVAGLSAAIAAERALIAQAHGDLLKLIEGQVGVLTAALAATAATLRREWATDLAPVTAELDQLGRLVRPIAAAGLLTIVPALVQELEQLRRTCIDPMCSVTTPQIPTLTLLADLATLGIVGGLAAEAVRDPEGTAKITAGAIGAIHSLAASLVADFSGLTV